MIKKLCMNGELKALNIHYNTESDIRVFKHSQSDKIDKQTNFFHVDTNMNSLKAMVYLGKVNKHNGPFEYVIESFKYNKSFLQFCKRKVTRNLQLHNRDETSVKKFNSLISFFKVKNEFSELDKSSYMFKFIKKNKVTFVSPNNFIIFDPLGIHRGGIVEKGERTALQLIFSSKDDWQL